MMILDMSFTDYESSDGDSDTKPAKKEKEKVTYINTLEDHNAAMERLNNRRK